MDVLSKLVFRTFAKDSIGQFQTPRRRSKRGEVESVCEVGRRDCHTVAELGPNAAAASETGRSGSTL